MSKAKETFSWSAEFLLRKINDQSGVHYRHIANEEFTILFSLSEEF
jgi:hypothetical protein